MRSARNGGVVVNHRGYDDACEVGASREWTSTARRRGHYSSGPPESVAPTALADAFVRAAEVRKLRAEEVVKFPDPKAYSTFLGVRWAETEGNPVCPVCAGIEVYRYEARKIFKCKQCEKQFSATSKTMFASRKLPFQGVLHCLTTVSEHAGISATNLGVEIGVSWKTAHSLGKRLGLQDGRATRGNLVGKVKLAYPYMPAGPLTDDHRLVAAISAAVPSVWPDEMRAEVCQEVALGILCGDYDRSDLPAAIEDCRLKYGRSYDMVKYGHLSLDAPAYGEDGNLRLIDMLDSEREHW